jgi:hypothetical protein
MGETSKGKIKKGKQLLISTPACCCRACWATVGPRVEYLIFIQFIKLFNLIILGVLNLPLIKETKSIIPFLLLITNSTAESLDVF